MIYSRQDDIVRIKTFAKEKVGDGGFWKDDAKWLGFISRGPGVYRWDLVFPVRHRISSTPHNHEVVHNGVLYYKPHIEFEHRNGQETTKYFESKEEMNSFAEDFIAETGVDWVSNE